MKYSWSSAHEAELCQLHKPHKAMLNKCVTLKINRFKTFFKRFQIQNKVYIILSHQHIHSFSTIISCFIHEIHKVLSRIRRLKSALAGKHDRPIYNNELLFENLSMSLLCLKPKNDLEAF